MRHLLETIREVGDLTLYTDEEEVPFSALSTADALFSSTGHGLRNATDRGAPG